MGKTERQSLTQRLVAVALNVFEIKNQNPLEDPLIIEGPSLFGREELRSDHLSSGVEEDVVVTEYGDPY